MFNFHEFYLGFWTTVALLTAAAYILICCSKTVMEMVDRIGDELNTKIDIFCGAYAQHIPYIGPQIDV